MMQNLLSRLKQWRDTQAKSEGVEGYRVLPNATLEALVDALPRTKEGLLAIKGIKEAKSRKYGAAILLMIEDQLSAKEGVTGNPESVTRKKPEESDSVTGYELPVAENTLSVSQFLDGVNVELSGMAARVKGEVSSVDERERVVYFTLKDGADESTVNCLIFKYQYNVSGIRIAVGDEVVVEGVPEIYKPYGKLSLKVGVIELFGEGALKKAYDELYQKLETEGLFAPDRKRLLPGFSERIALITSERGAAIDDFKMNLGLQGFKICFYPTSVEGKKAVFEILKAIRYFNRTPKDYDVLVIIRGGGSLESLQAFNNETLVRAVAESQIPTLLGVGHEKDVTLSALVADRMVSTPTATARTLREPWDEARQLVAHFHSQLPLLFSGQLAETRVLLFQEGEIFLSHLRIFQEMVGTLRQKLMERLMNAQAFVRERRRFLGERWQNTATRYASRMKEARERLSHLEERLRQYDPLVVLRLGYSLVRKNGTIVRNTQDVAVGDRLDVRLSRGGFTARVENVLDN